MSVEFWDHKQNGNENGNENFRFKGPYNGPATKEISQIARKAAERKDAHDSEASSSILS